jgi:CspA family cold shock protein
MSQNDTTAPTTHSSTCESNEVTREVGKYIGQCKWFNDILGYGFVTQQSGDDKGKDIFVHHSGVCPLNSHYKTLRKGEYVNFNVVCGENGDQAVDVTGINGGTLMCDVSPIVRTSQRDSDSQGADGAAGGGGARDYGRGGGRGRGRGSARGRGYGRGADVTN